MEQSEIMTEFMRFRTHQIPGVSASGIEAGVPICQPCPEPSDVRKSSPYATRLGSVRIERQDIGHIRVRGKVLTGGPGSSIRLVGPDMDRTELATSIRNS